MNSFNIDLNCTSNTISDTLNRNNKSSVFNKIKKDLGLDIKAFKNFQCV